MFLPGAFRNVAVHIQQQRFVIVIVGDFLMRQDGIGIRADRFGAAHVDVHMMAGEAGSLHAYALLHALVAQIGTPWPGGDRDMGGQRLGGDARRFGAVECDRADVAGFQFVGTDDLQLRRHEGGLVVGHLHLKDVRGIEQPVGVLLQTEDRSAFGGLVGTHAFKHTHAVMQGMGQHVGGGIAPRHKLAVVPDKTVAVGHRHNGLPSNWSVTKRGF